MTYVAPLGEERWRELIEEHRAGSASIKDFCAEKSVSKSAFLENRKKLTGSFVKVPVRVSPLLEVSAKLFSFSFYIELKRNA